MSELETEAGAPQGQPGAPPLWARAILDIAEKLFVVGLYGLLVWSVINAVGRGANWLNLVILGAEGLNVIFILARARASVVSYKPSDWLLSIGATAGSLLVRPGKLAPLGPPSLAGALIGMGLLVQIMAKLTLRRSFGMAPANRGLKTTGLYRYVRHPIYLGYLTGWIGFFLLNPTVWNAAVYAFCIVCQALRIEAEEKVLALDPAHAEYRANVRYKVIPGVY